MIRKMRNHDSVETPVRNMTRTTKEFMKEIRYKEWKKTHDWKEDDMETCNVRSELI